MLALNRQIEKALLRNKGRVIVMLGVIQFDQASPLDPENSNPLKLMLIAGAIIFPYTGVDTPPATDAPGEIEAVSPKGIRKGILRTDLKFPAIFLQVSLFEFGNNPFLFFRSHLFEMFLQEIFGLLFRTGREKGKRKPRQSGD